MALVKVPSSRIHDINIPFASDADRVLFDQAWDRVQHHNGGYAFGAGAGLHEAKRWHRRAYSRSGEINSLTPAEIGHAAAYEAFKGWLHENPAYDVLDTERQRAILIGLAVAESMRLLQYLPYKAGDSYSRSIASEAAASTASILFYQSRDPVEDGYRSRYDREGWSSGEEYHNEYDDYHRRARSHSRPRRHASRSRSRHRSSFIPTQTSMPIPQPGYITSMSGMPTSAYPTPYGAGYNAYGTTTTAVPGSTYPSMPIAGNLAYSNGSVPMVAGAPISYAQPIYPGPTTVGQPQVIVLPAHHHRKHRHHHDRSRSRSSSRDPPYNNYTHGMRY